jgi:hypothetical protein
MQDIHRHKFKNNNKPSLLLALIGKLPKSDTTVKPEQIDTQKRLEAKYSAELNKFEEEQQTKEESC